MFRSKRGKDTKFEFWLPAQSRPTTTPLLPFRPSQTKKREISKTFLLLLLPLPSNKTRLEALIDYFLIYPTHIFTIRSNHVEAHVHGRKAQGRSWHLPSNQTCVHGKGNLGLGDKGRRQCGNVRTTTSMYRKSLEFVKCPLAD